LNNVYVIAGCNGAGKTTASFTILPEMLECQEFVNADEIAKGLSPFKPETANFAAGRLMLERIRRHISHGIDFAFETTLATRSYVKLLEDAHSKDYQSTLLFFYLDSPELAIRRVETRVNEGGHDIPKEVIIRRYHNGLRNFFNLFEHKVSDWMFIDNSSDPFKIIAESVSNTERIFNKSLWDKLRQTYHED